MHKKRLVSLIAVASVTALILAGCSSGSDSASDGGVPKVDMMKELGAGEGQVNVVAWAGYVENGSTDPMLTGSLVSKKKLVVKLMLRTAQHQMTWSH